MSGLSALSATVSWTNCGMPVMAAPIKCACSRTAMLAASFALAEACLDSSTCSLLVLFDMVFSFLFCGISVLRYGLLNLRCVEFIHGFSVARSFGFFQTLKER